MSLRQLTIHRTADAVDAGKCLSLVLEREIYTPYDTVSGVFLADAETDYSDAVYVELSWLGESIFIGLADRVEKYQRGGGWFLQVQSRTFTSLLTQNELEPGLHANQTLHSLIHDFYTLPFVTAEEHPATGYIFVREKTSLWDSVATFVFRNTGRYPYVQNNFVRFTLEEEPDTYAPPKSRVVQAGDLVDTTRLISHYHMEDIEGNPNAYEQENPAAQHALIVRHKQIPFDRQFLSNPMLALSYRNRFSCRGTRAQYVTYAGFANEQLGDRVQYGEAMRGRICRVRMTFSGQGYRTTLWKYEDGFFNPTET